MLALFRSRNAQAVVELALRQQLATYVHTRAKPMLRLMRRYGNESGYKAVADS